MLCRLRVGVMIAGTELTHLSDDPPSDTSILHTIEFESPNHSTRPIMYNPAHMQSTPLTGQAECLRHRGPGILPGAHRSHLNSRLSSDSLRLRPLCLLALALGLAAASPAAQVPGKSLASGREESFDFGWRFLKGAAAGANEAGYDDSKWRTLDLPHDWSIEDLEALPAAGPMLAVTKGTWRFAKGDDMEWKATGFDDSKWQEVRLPAAWEQHSQYKDDKSYGWYRRKFAVPAALKGKEFRLAVGWVKDADQTFVNGVLVGSTGAFPPEFRRADIEDRYYKVPPALVKGDGSDVVAVRVYRQDGYGGGIFLEQMPHTRSGPFDTKAPNGPSVGYTLNGSGWYRKHFTLAAAPANEQVRIQFDGVYMNADVWVNGQLLGNHPYGYTGFGYDLTKYLRPGGDNVIAVEVKNLGSNSRWYAGSGIYRHVRLIRSGEVHVPQWGTFITTPEVSAKKALLRLRTQVTNVSANSAPVQLRTKILTSDGRLIATGEATKDVAAAATEEFDQQISVANPGLWSLEKPLMHTAVCEVMVKGKVVDSVRLPFGIRSITFDSKDGFKLNGESMKLKGSCMHHDNGPLGAAAYDDAEFRRVRLTKAAGFNAIRCAHNPPSEAFLNACDQLGVLVMDEAFDCWKGGKNSDDYGRYFTEWWQRDVDSMLLRDRNHPSVIMWSIGNEIPGNDSAPVAAIAHMLAERVRQLDPTRPVTSGIQGVNPKKDDYMAALDVAGYNYALKWNEGHTYKKNAYVDDHERQPARVIVGTESFAAQSFDYWMPVVDYPWVIGDFVWTGWDYLGESSLGWIGYGIPVYWPVAYCGDIGLTGLRRPQSYYRGAMFGNDALAAFVQRPEPLFSETRRYDWGADDVSASWTWPGYEGKNLTVSIYSSCDEVELFLNDKSLGRRPTTREQKFRTDFGVPYQPGCLKAVGYKNGKSAAEWSLESAAAPAAIRLHPERATMAADGQSLAFVPFEVVDAKGHLDANANPLVHIKIEGPGVLAAIANADPSSRESFQQPQRKAWQGCGLVIVKSTRKPGHIRVTATSDGLAPATVDIETK
ncbi:MAG: glycoside hydrolase family 2 protein [Verrucomicrobia bacterium]|nr:MAG: glycoside hydrolase family 2 protein [Verrucomicrobiota bacterium]